MWNAKRPSHLSRLGDLITHLAVEAEAMQELGWMIRESLEGKPKGVAQTTGARVIACASLVRFLIPTAIEP